MNLQIRALKPDDPPAIAAAFHAIGWNKPESQYISYLHEQALGERDILLGEVDGEFAGYLTIRWIPEYEPFRATGIPEIQDLNVLPRWRRKGIATALIDAAEARIGRRSAVSGIGVGMDPDYGNAQKLYVLRGYVPDGNGLTSHLKHVNWGETVKVDDDLVLYFTKSLGTGGSGDPRK